MAKDETYNVLGETSSESSSSKNKKLLFLDKVLIKGKYSSSVRGVELFNFNLIKDLMAQGYQLTLPIAKNWQPEVEPLLKAGAIRIIWLPSIGEPIVKSLLAVCRLLSSRFDFLILGNVGKGMVYSVVLLHLLAVVERSILIAHREANPFFLKSLKRFSIKVLAVNEVIRQAFVDEGYDNPEVYYGVTDSYRFLSSNSAEKDSSSSIVNFGVLGYLDNSWKGADVAIQAFDMLPQIYKKQAILHLAAFENREQLEDKFYVKKHNWIDPKNIPSFLSSLDVMIVPTKVEKTMRETFCQAMVQGMLSGLPIIASNLPILTEKLESGGGIVFKTPQELSDAIQTLIEDKELRDRLGKEAKMIALENYVWDSRDFAKRFL